MNEIRKARAALPASSKAVADKMTTIEEALMQVNMKGSEANLAFPGMLNERLATFALNIDDADTPPTEQNLALYKDMHAKLDAQLAAWEKLKAN